MQPSGIVRALAVGAVCGLRTMCGPATVLPLTGARRAVVVALALGELIADKLPQTPSRTQPLGLAARAITSAVSAASTAGDKRERLPAALLGVAAAMGAAFAGAGYRAWCARRRLPAIPSALAEDALAYGAGTLLARER
jgi:uncharacterized membrane protein